MQQGEELEAVERELKEALKQQQTWTEEKQREAWAKQLKEAKKAEQQKRDVWVAKKEAGPIHSQVSKTRTPAAKGQDGKAPPAKRGKIDKEPPTNKEVDKGPQAQRAKKDKTDNNAKNDTNEKKGKKAKKY